MSIAKVLFGLESARTQVGHLHYFNTCTALETLKYAGFEVIDFELSVAFLKILPRNLRQWVVLPLPLLSVVFGKRFAAAVFGGISLVVLCKQPEEQRTPNNQV